METNFSKSIVERDSRLYERPYHLNKITILEIEHATRPDYSVSLRPPLWEKTIEDEMYKHENDLNFPEYCIPDMYRRVFREPGFGEIAKDVFIKNGTYDSYSYVSKVSGLNGKNLYAADIANTSWFEFYGQIIFANSNNIHDKSSDPDTVDQELQTITSVHNMRHLILARAMMQTVLKTNKSILHINAPVHSIAIDDLIDRQNQYEKMNNSSPVVNPSDFLTMCPELEFKKMRLYSKLPFLDTCIREFKPILQPSFYKIDIDFTKFASGKMDKMQFADSLSTFSKIIPKNKIETAISTLISGFDDPDNLEMVKRVADRISTDRKGWEMISKTKVF